MNRRSTSLLTVAAFGYAFLYLPIVSVVIYSFNDSRLVTLWGGFSLRWYRSLLEDEQILSAALLSLEIALVSATVATALGTLAGLALNRLGRFGGRTLLTSIIMVEIIFIKIFQLFLGSPAISISIIIFSLLISSGIGSLFSKRLSRALGPRLPAVFAVFLAVLLTAYGFGLFGLLDRFIFLPFPWRIVVSFFFISLAGFFMGSYFPDGIRRLGEADKVMIGWAWGANSFATVLGSILAVIASINWDFTVVLVLAAMAYLAAGACSLIAGRAKAA